jgi:lipoate-protein ligase B
MAAGGPRPLLAVVDLTARGLMRYAASLALQERFAELRRAGAAPDTLLLVQHEPVYTIGKRGSLADFRGGVEVRRLLVNAEFGAGWGAATQPNFHTLPIKPPTPHQAARASGASIATIPRGGETTYHGPGQLVAYPVLALRGWGLGARAYVEGLEDAMAAVAGAYGVAAHGRVPGRTGVWVGERKLGAVGVRISQGVSSHGLALNVDTDLAAFAAIVPCGAPDKSVTTLAAEVRADGPLGLSRPAALLTDALVRALDRHSSRRSSSVDEVGSCGSDQLQAHSLEQLLGRDFDYDQLYL